ncbi:TetR/AcrR family transcriptional regulator [Kibdelosporangium philippinense]|uniref:TetR/AcrR family transcriptional regulator n=1 Tax=Kibdelosporangium philippinense TaxID=211113 RepID=A0ABS8Z6R5_9PSEU|nr:TetR/AcrR family transcriptional regulator [Kibdelosporangium philippinense]MCE7003569.1 TetR/AcrR family transcriptional regulator [Kibdelosporangium philippinense]
MRADAQRNRAQIVAAARTLFVSKGVDTPMEEIARAAGVGVGTLYRRFPDRDALMNAVSTDMFERLVEMITSASAAESSAWGVLQRFLRSWAEMRLGLLLDPMCHGMPAAIEADPQLRTVRQEWLDLFDDLIQQAHVDGELRKDVGLAEIATFMNMVVRDDRSEVTDRILDVMIDGLKA